MRWGAGEELRTDDPGTLIAGLVARGADLSGLTVTRPSLEDTYLSLIGDAR